MIHRKRLLAIARKEVLQLRRDRRSLALAFVLPLVLVVIFAYGISWDVNDIRTVVVDQDHTSRSRALVDAFRSSGYFAIEEVDASAEVDSLIDRGEVQLAVVIPQVFARDLGGGTAAEIQAIVDGSDANTATIVLGYAQAVTQAYAKALLQSRGASARPAVTLQTRVW